MKKRAPKVNHPRASFFRTKEFVVKAAHHTSVLIPWTPLAVVVRSIHLKKGLFLIHHPSLLKPVTYLGQRRKRVPHLMMQGTRRLSPSLARDARKDQYQRTALVLGSLVDGLYQLPNLPSASSTALAVSQSTDSSLWHKRLGHVPSKVLSKIHDSVVQCNNTSTCTICPLAKQCELPFVSSQSHANHPFDLVHCDLWGPYRTPTYNGCKYFLTLVDDCTRGLWTILLPTKQHASQSIKDFFAYVFTQFGVHIKYLRNDNGGNFSVMT
ncbi:hypothetical protein AgCh_036762 [Apium graveolens]